MKAIFSIIVCVTLCFGVRAGTIDSSGYDTNVFVISKTAGTVTLNTNANNPKAAATKGDLALKVSTMYGASTYQFLEQPTNHYPTIIGGTNYASDRAVMSYIHPNTDHFIFTDDGGNPVVELNTIDQIYTFSGALSASSISGNGSGLTVLPASQLNGTIPLSSLPPPLIGSANLIEQRNGTTSQRFNIYNTFTDASNYRRGVLYFSGADFHVGTESAGTGTGSGNLYIDVGGAHRMVFRANGTDLWGILDPTAGGVFQAQTDNTYDIGFPAIGRPRTGYFGTSVVAPLFQGGSFSGDGSGLTALNASALASGTVALGRLPAQVLTNNEASPVTFNAVVTNMGPLVITNKLIWTFPTGSLTNVYAALAQQAPGDIRWAFYPHGYPGVADLSWGFEFTSSGYAILEGINNSSSVNLTSGGQIQLFANGGVESINTFQFDDNVEMLSDLNVDGKVTSSGGYDPPYVLYDANTREITKARVLSEVPAAKQTGAALFFNSQTHRLETYVASEDTFYDLNGNVISTNVTADSAGLAAQKAAHPKRPAAKPITNSVPVL